MRRSRFPVLLLLLLPASLANADPFELDVLETPDLRLLYFDPFQTYLTPHVVRTFQNSLDFQKKVFGWTPYDKTTVLLTDFTDYGNGAALVAPGNMVIINVAPKNRTLESAPSTERFFQLMNHELVHVATMDGWSRQDARWRRLFAGKPRQTDEHPESILYNYLTAPRLSSPRWYAEGSATFMETWLSSGIGRAQGAYDEMVFRAMVRDGAHFYSNLGLVSEGTQVDFQVGVNAYLYGTRFMSYLALEYSPEKLIEWLGRDEDGARYYAKQFERVYGKTLEAAWDDWIAFEHAFQTANLESVRQFPLTPMRPLTEQALGSISRSFYDPELDAMVGAFRYPGVVAHIGALSLADGRIDRIVDIKGPMLYRVTSPAYDARTKTLYYTADNLAYRDLMKVDIETGEKRLLIEDARIGDLVFEPNDEALWALRHLNGLVSLVKILPPYAEWQQVYTWPQGNDPYELDISPDGELLSVSVSEINGDQFLRVFRVDDIVAGEADPILEFDFSPAIPEGFVFSADGRYLFGSSYYTGVSNIFRYEIATGEMEAVSNAETGFFRPIPREDGSLIVFEFTGQGFLPAVIDPVPLEDVSAITFLGAQIASRYEAVREWSVVGTLAGQPYEEAIIHRGKYRPYRELGLTSSYPIVEGYRDSEAVGWHLDFQDPAQLHHLSLTAGWSWDDELPANEQLHFNVQYKALNWRLRYWHNDADFYDLFGPTKRSRKGDAFLVGYERALIYDEPRRLDLSADLAYYTGLDTLPGNQNVSTFLFEDILHGEIGLRHTNTRESLGAVDHEKGWRWNVDVSTDTAEGDTIPKLRGGIDAGFALPWKHSSIWFYNSAGAADGDLANPLTSFYFGSYGNNYVDDGEIKRYRVYDSFPGFEIDEISARQFVKSVAEWNLPPIRFEAVGKPGFYLSHLRPAVFIGGLVTDPGEAFERTVTNLGVQIDLSFTLAHRLPMTLSVGYALGYEDGNRQNDEWMLSLKIL